MGMLDGVGMKDAEGILDVEVVGHGRCGHGMHEEWRMRQAQRTEKAVGMEDVGCGRHGEL